MLGLYTEVYAVLFVLWSSGNVSVYETRGLRLKPRTGQIGHSVANGSPPLRYLFERSCVARAQLCGDGPCLLVTRFGVYIQRVLQKI